MKKSIVLNEEKLRKIISESVKGILSELFDNGQISPKKDKSFVATSPDFWKNYHGYNDEKANKASEWMNRHYGSLEEDDLDGGDFEDDEIDDWRSEEPSQNSVQSIMSSIQQKCAQNGATFKNLGDNEFGVISGNQGCPLIASFLRSMENNGTIYKTGGEILPNDVLRIKYRIIKG